MAKKFMFACLGILALVAAYSLGAKDVVAQSGAPVFVGITSGGGISLAAITANGDLYGIGDTTVNLTDPPYVGWFSRNNMGVTDNRRWTYMGNVTEAPVEAKSNSLGGVKSLFR